MNCEVCGSSNVVSGQGAATGMTIGRCPLHPFEVAVTTKANKWLENQRPWWQPKRSPYGGGSTFMVAVFVGGDRKAHCGFWPSDDLKRGSGFENPQGVLTAEEALSLAQWIIDTFGEDTKS